MSHFRQSVIPAKAGIQSTVQVGTAQIWTPACSGVTSEVAEWMPKQVQHDETGEEEF